MLSREAVVSLAPDPTGDSPGAVLLARDLSGAVPIRGPRGSPADLSFAAGVLRWGPKACRGHGRSHDPPLSQQQL